MARGFNATLGTTTSDRVATTLTTHSVLRTWSIWVNIRTAANGEFWNRTNGNEAISESVSNGVVFKRDTASTHTAEWRYTAPATGTWTNILVTYDDSTPTVAPIMYFNGVVQTLQTTIAPVGAATVDSTNPVVIGNRVAADRAFDGMLAEFAVWDRILSAGEAGVMAHYSPLCLPQSLVEYVPMIRDNTSLKNVAPTITGALVQPHPPIIYPTYAQVRFRPPFVPYSTAMFQAMLQQTQGGAAMIGRTPRGVYG